MCVAVSESSSLPLGNRVIQLTSLRYVSYFLSFFPLLLVLTLDALSFFLLDAIRVLSLSQKKSAEISNKENMRERNALSPGKQ